jgi:MFS family permease
LLATGLPQAEVSRLVANDAWRLLMILGVAPALLTFFFRLFVPESEKWEQEQKSGGTNHWATRDLIGVLIGSTGPGLIIYVFSDSKIGWQVRLVASVAGIIIATLGYLYPVMQYLKRAHLASGETVNQNRSVIGRMLMAACLSGVALMGTWGASQQTPSWGASLVDQKPATPPAADPAKADAAKADEKQPDGRIAVNSDVKLPETVVAPKIAPGAASGVTLIFLSLGAITGTILGALAGGRFGRRITYCILCLLSLMSAWLWGALCNSYGYEFLFFAFLTGTFTASFYGWLPLYLPELFGTNIRATGQGFGFNFGRILAAVGALQGTAIRDLFQSDLNFGGLIFPKGYPALIATISLIYLVGAIFIWFCPETKDKPLPD